MEREHDVVVVGAGISGLTVAFHLSRAGLDVAVLEASARVGGAIETLHDGDWLFEQGPNTVLESRPSVGRLIREAGLGEAKIEASPEGKRRYLWKGERLVPLPSGPIGFLASLALPSGGQAPPAPRALDPAPGRRPRGDDRPVRAPPAGHRLPRLRRRPLRLGCLRRRPGAPLGALGGTPDRGSRARARKPRPRRPRAPQGPPAGRRDDHLRRRPRDPSPHPRGRPRNGRPAGPDRHPMPRDRAPGRRLRGRDRRRYPRRPPGGGDRARRRGRQAPRPR